LHTEPRNRLVCGSTGFRQVQWTDLKGMRAGGLSGATTGKEYEGRPPMERPREGRLRGTVKRSTCKGEPVEWTVNQGEIASERGMKESFAMTSGPSARPN